MFGWLRAKNDDAYTMTYRGGSAEPPPPPLEPKGDVLELREFILGSETTRRDPVTGLPRLPDGWAWALRQSAGGGRWLRIEDAVTSHSDWGYHVAVRGGLSREEVPGVAHDALRYWRTTAQRQLKAAPLGQYPPNSVAE